MNMNLPPPETIVTQWVYTHLVTLISFWQFLILEYSTKMQPANDLTLHMPAHYVHSLESSTVEDLITW